MRDHLTLNLESGIWSVVWIDLCSSVCFQLYLLFSSGVLEGTRAGHAKGGDARRIPPEGGANPGKDVSGTYRESFFSWIHEGAVYLPAFVSFIPFPIVFQTVFLFSFPIKDGLNVKYSNWVLFYTGMCPSDARFDEAEGEESSGDNHPCRSP